MSVTEHSPFKSSPRISRPKFIQVLDETGSFEADALWGATPNKDHRTIGASMIYAVIVDRGHDPGVWLAILGKESSFGTNENSVLWRNSTHSWTNARTIRDPAVLTRTLAAYPELNHESMPKGTIYDIVRGSRYVKYLSALDSVLDGIYRVDEAGFAYRGANAVSILDHINVWAPDTDGNRPVEYARTMAQWINEWVATDYNTVPNPPEESMIIKGLTDIRHRMAKPPNDTLPRGPKERVNMTQKSGVVVHYRGVITTPAPGADSFVSDSSYHVRKNWARAGNTPIYGDGIMYHVGIGWDAKKYWLRDFDEVLWHCEETARNRTALSVQLPMGGNQRATPEMLKALGEVVDDWRAFTNAPRSQVWGHQEITNTGCPGTLMADFVQPYRVFTEQPVRPDALLIGGDHPWGQVPIVSGFKWLYLETGKVKYPDNPITGGLTLWGYPEGPEYETADGAAQVFERAIFRWYRGVPAPWDIVISLRHEEIPPPK